MPFPGPIWCSLGPSVAQRVPFTGIEIPPCWRVVPPSRTGHGTGIRVVLEPGAGFGTGTHETTQLCLQAIAALGPRGLPWRMLDFGSGSGILAIAAAKLGATVQAIEIDPGALAHAERNARLNGVAERISWLRTLAGASGSFELVVANILRPVLLAHADELLARCDPAGTLVLSGLVSTDVPEVSVRYGSRLTGKRPQIHERGDWRALVWRLAAPGAGSRVDDQR